MIYNLFPVPIFKGHFAKANELKELLLPKFEEFEKSNKMTSEYSNNGYTSFGFNENVLLWEECSDLLNVLGQEIANMHLGTGLTGNVFLENSWFSINRKGSYHEAHNHIPSIWSGCYYVQSNPAEDAGITFLNSNFNSNWPFISKSQVTDYTNSSSTFFNEDGTFLLFPSYLMHKVEQQLSDNDRITIAFNFNSIGETHD